ncbi:MAG: type II toxin-antitoxin system VapB family antitoxin [Candidatus Methylomirabilota bacterium]
MRTTLDLPQPLLEEAMQLSPERTKTATIIAALEDFVRKQKIRGLKRFRGRVDLDIDLSGLRDRK